MSQQYDNELRGVLFKNTAKRPDKPDPDYRGRVTVQGVEYWLDAWIATSKNGEKYMQLRVKHKEGTREQPQSQRQAATHPQQRPAAARRDEFDDPIPF